ncbi:MAG: YraN family protein [Ghiorsea sp.]
MSTKKGKEAENAACRYLKRHGYTVLDRNKRLGRGELDIVAIQAETLAFIEVKAQKDRESSLASMHTDKCERFISAANTWLGLHDQYAQYQCRFDLIIVVPRNIPLMPPEIEHMMDVIRL